ncbi:amidohydrolase [Maledivibacter halophilus]|uniref:Amidohydrolase 3 domain-containing protein n=1 Tax=Maledivibacter halophilus TaxID=36842 RepID=A0A1T5LKA7_9FIRM|nr:amidohydrolase [Maledivibacter halophilus]SKC76205.1 hypothetical protein SAMN02194393_02954 [Maledivibacter halophilus]
MDLILKNGKVATMDSLGTIAEAIGIKDGKIDIIGTNDEVLRRKSSNTEIIDLNNRLVLPGFIDSHMHMLNYGYTSQQLALGDSRSVDDLIKSGARYLGDKQIKKGNWVLGRGWNQDYFIEKRFPNRKDLDKISLDHPICFTRACGHVAVANSRAIEIVKDKRDEGIENTNIDWELGFFKEDALDVLYSSIEAPSVQEIKNMIIKAAGDFIKSGITSVQTDDFNAMPDNDYRKVLKAYKELIEEGKLSVRVYEQCLLPDEEELKSFLNRGYKTGTGDERFKIGPLKLLIDGSLGAGTALLCDGYYDDPSTYGVSVYTQDELNDIVLLAHKNEMQIAIHAIGDKAMYMALDSIKNANESFYREDPRHGVVHCQITDEELIDRFREENIIAYIQPIFLDYDLHIVEERVGKEKAKKTYNWKTMMNKGINLSGGSDTPVVGFNIMENIYSAVTRMDLNGYPKNGWLPEERLTVDEAIKLFTVNGAYASFEENIKGSLEVGKLADMVVLSQNVFEIDKEKIREVDVLMTIIDGKIVFKV